MEDISGGRRGLAVFIPRYHHHSHHSSSTSTPNRPLTEEEKRKSKRTMIIAIVVTIVVFLVIMLIIYGAYTNWFKYNPFKKQDQYYTKGHYIKKDSNPNHDKWVVDSYWVKHVDGTIEEITENEYIEGLKKVGLMD